MALVPGTHPVPSPEHMVMPTPVKAVPDCLHTLTPHLVLKDAARMIEFYVRAFGATERGRMTGPGGGIAHAELMIGDSVLFLADEFPGAAAQAPATAGGPSVVLHLYVEDADAAFARAVGAGATVTIPLMDAFWGDRFGQVRDPAGHVWSIATHVEDVTPAEMKKRQEEWAASLAKG